MAAPRAVLVLAVSLAVVAAASGCTYCPPNTPAVPTPPVVPTPPTTSGGRSCPRDALKLHVCADVLGLVKAKVGAPYGPCCSLLDGLVGLDAAVCLCTAIKANVLGLNLNIPVDLSLILNNCGKICPADFRCV